MPIPIQSCHQPNWWTPNQDFSRKQSILVIYQSRLTNTNFIYSHYDLHRMRGKIWGSLSVKIPKIWALTSGRPSVISRGFLNTFQPSTIINWQINVSFIVSSSTIDIFYQIYTFYQNRYQIYIFHENSYQICIFSEK